MNRTKKRAPSADGAFALIMALDSALLLETA